MGKCFCFLSCLGLASVCGVSHGTPYPSWTELRRLWSGDQSCLWSGNETHVLLGDKMGDVLKRAFKHAYTSADLKLIGEKNKSLTLPKNGIPAYYNPNDYRDWQWKFDTIYGFFSCTVQGVSVFNEKTLQMAVGQALQDTLGKDFISFGVVRMANVVKVCHVLLSEKFVKQLLQEPLLQALYANKDVAYSCFDVKFDDDFIKFNGDFGKFVTFDVGYYQVVKKEARKATGASDFALVFRFTYNVDKCDFVVKDVGSLFSRPMPKLLEIACLGINGGGVRENLLAFDARLMDRVWEHPYWERRMCQGEEKIAGRKRGSGCLRRGAKNFGKSEENLELEEGETKVHSEENKAVTHKKAKVLKPSDPKKRSRSPDLDDEKAEGKKSFKRKKEK